MSFIFNQAIEISQNESKAGIKHLVKTDIFVVMSCDYCVLITSDVSANQVKSNMPSVN